MDPNLADEFRPIPDDPEEQRRIKARLFRKIIEQSPEVANEILQEGIERGIERGREEGIARLLRLFERKLSRPLAGPEHLDLVRRLGAMGPDRLGDLVIDLTPDALGAWLADPKST